MVVRFKGKDMIRAVWKPYIEASYGTAPATGTEQAFPSHLVEIIPQYDPEIEPVYVLRGESATHGLPIALLGRRKNTRFRLTCYQPTKVSGYWQKNFLKDADAVDLYTNFWLETQIKRDAGEKFYIQADGLKMNTITVRSSIGDNFINWILDLIGQDTTVFDSSVITAYGSELTGNPWRWAESYIQYDIGGGYVTMPDMQDYELRIEHNLRPNFVYNAAGNFTVSSIDDMEHKPTARITHITNDKTFINALIAETANVKIKLFLPDSKYIEMTGGKFRKAEPTIKVEDHLLSRLEYIGSDYTHNFD